MIFSRRRRASAGQHRDERPIAETKVDPTPPVSEQAAEPARTPQRRTVGPYDLSEAPSGTRRLDLGSLHIPSVPGVELRMQANPDGAIQRVALVHGESALQVAAFAAPRSEGIWDEVRPEIQAALIAERATVEEVDGEYGRELRGRIQTQEGPEDLRVVGIDGPRWMVRADFYGPAAVDPGQGQPLWECLRGIVVERDSQARPVREPLPLRLSPELTAQVQRRQRQAGAPPAGAVVPGGDGAAGDGRATSSPRPRRRS